MNTCVNFCKDCNWSNCLPVTGFLAAVSPLIVPIAVLVSAVAIPIFAVKALIHRSQHQHLYEKTLLNQKREVFGRLPGQDYTKWDGKAVENHEEEWDHRHGRENCRFLKQATVIDQYPFQSEEDRKWLQIEHQRVSKKWEYLNDLSKIRAFAKGLIPLVGIIWIIFTEINNPGKMDPTKGAFLTTKLPFDSGDFWDTWEALDYHQEKALLQKQGIAMDCSDLQVKKSGIGQLQDGLGVFAKKDFKKGDVVIKWMFVITDREYQTLSMYEKENCCCRRQGKLYYYPDPERHINQSKDPNLAFDFKRQATIALRDIQKGEELSISDATEEVFKG